MDNGDDITKLSLIDEKTPPPKKTPSEKKTPAASVSSEASSSSSSYFTPSPSSSYSGGSSSSSSGVGYIPAHLRNKNAVPSSIFGQLDPRRTENPTWRRQTPLSDNYPSTKASSSNSSNSHLLNATNKPGCYIPPHLKQREGSSQDRWTHKETPPAKSQRKRTSPDTWQKTSQSGSSPSSPLRKAPSSPDRWEKSPQRRRAIYFSAKFPEMEEDDSNAFRYAYFANLDE